MPVSFLLLFFGLPWGGSPRHSILLVQSHYSSCDLEMLNYGYVPFPGYLDYLLALKIKTFNRDIK